MGLFQCVFAQNMLATCDYPEIAGSDMISRYGNGRGDYDDTSLDLNHCFGNNQGQLVFRHEGNAFHSCKDLTIQGPGDNSLSSLCPDSHGTVHVAFINFSKFELQPPVVKPN